MKMLLVLISVALTGCASLQVEVSILERSVVDDLYISDRIDEALPSLRVEKQDDINLQVTKLQTAHHDVYAAAATAIETEAQRMQDNAEEDKKLKKDARTLSSIARKLMDDYNTVWSPAYTEFEQAWNLQNQAIRKLDPVTNVSAEDSVLLRRRIWSLLRSRDSLIENFFARVLEDLDVGTSGELPNPQIREAVKIVGNARIATIFADATEQALVQQELIELFTSGGLEHSRYAAVVAGADDDLWYKEFDFARGSGVFGKLDVAIKALGPTNFTIKGVAFDPSDVALAASKVTTQSLLLAAQISGVPVKIQGTPSGDGASLALSSAGVQSQRAEIVHAENNVSVFNLALDRVAHAILDEAEEIQSGDTDRIAEASNAINSIYASQQARLDALLTPAGDEQTPAGDEQAPAGDEQAPADDEQAPADDEQAPADDEQAPADDEQAPADDEQAPADDEQVPADDEQAPADDEQAPADEGTEQ